MKAARNSKIDLFVAMILIPVLYARTGGAETQNIEGIWIGTLKVSMVEMRIVFKISKSQNGSLAATMDSPDQGAKNIPMDEVTFENNRLHLELKLVQGKYDGVMNEDGSIDGTWQQSGLSVPLVLKRTDEAPKLNRPQEPKKPYPYIEEEVSYENEKAQIKLAGTLTLPRSGGPFPAVILITGSGAQDRNETIVGHRPFLVLADHLTRNGIAVLRVDDRGVGGSTGNVLDATSEAFAGDMLAGVKFLKNRKDVRPGQIGLIGHSEGGIIAPIAAAQSPDIAFIILMAGTGLTGEDILHSQSDLVLKAAGASDEIIALQHSALRQILDVMKSQKDRSAAEKEIRRVMTDVFSKLSPKEKEAMGMTEATVEIQLKMILSEWFRFFVTYDPKPTLMKVKCPVLAINGQLDLQVPPKENLSAIEQALKAGGNTQYTIRILPQHNHLFQRAQTGAISEYAKIEETISPIALELISQWILAQTGQADK